MQDPTEATQNRSSDHPNYPSKKMMGELSRNPSVIRRREIAEDLRKSVMTILSLRTEKDAKFAVSTGGYKEKPVSITEIIQTANRAEACLQAIDEWEAEALEMVMLESLN